MRTVETEIVHVEFFGGWVIKQRIEHTDGPYKGRYVDFPDSVAGPLDSEIPNAYGTKEQAEAALSRLEDRQ